MQSAREGNPRHLLFTPHKINFKRISAGKSSHIVPVTLTNSGDASLGPEFIGLEGDNRGELGIETNSCGSTLQVGETCTLGVGLFPGDFGAVGAEIYMKDTAVGSPQTVMLYGYGAH